MSDNKELREAAMQLREAVMEYELADGSITTARCLNACIGVERALALPPSPKGAPAATDQQTEMTVVNLGTGEIAVSVAAQLKPTPIYSLTFHPLDHKYEIGADTLSEVDGIFHKPSVWIRFSNMESVDVVLEAVQKIRALFIPIETDPEKAGEGSSAGRVDSGPSGRPGDGPKLLKLESRPQLYRDAKIWAESRKGYLHLFVKVNGITHERKVGFPYNESDEFAYRINAFEPPEAPQPDKGAQT